MNKILIAVWMVLRDIGKRFVQDRLTYSASALTYTTLLALVPLFAVTVTILTLFPVFHLSGNTIHSLVFQNFLPKSGQLIQSHLKEFISQATELPLISIVFLAVTTVLMMFAIERSFNDIWHTHQQRRGISLWLHWIIMSVAPILIIISIVVTSEILNLPFVVKILSRIKVEYALLHSMPFIVTVFIFNFLYVVVPNCKVPFRAAFLGALVATILFAIVKKGFVLYLTFFPTYQLIYGAMAVIPIFLIWLYLLWTIILFGALVSNVLTVRWFEND